MHRIFRSSLIATGLLLVTSLPAADLIRAIRAVEPPYRVEIYTALFCGHCKAAKARLRDAGIAYEEIPLIFHGDNHAEMLRRTHGEDGAPRIFINGHYLGTRRDLDAVPESALQRIGRNEPVSLTFKSPAPSNAENENHP